MSIRSCTANKKLYWHKYDLALAPSISLKTRSISDQSFEPSLFFYIYSPRVMVHCKQINTGTLFEIKIEIEIVYLSVCLYGGIKE